MPEAREIDATRLIAFRSCSPSFENTDQQGHQEENTEKSGTLIDICRIQWTEVLFLVVSQPLYNLNGTSMSIGWCILILTMEYRVPLVQPTKTRYRHALPFPPQMQLSLLLYSNHVETPQFVSDFLEVPHKVGRLPIWRQY